jgi:hypothetical protein
MWKRNGRYYTQLKIKKLILEHLENLSPGFVSGRADKRFARKFERTIHLAGLGPLSLIASCLDWARHRRAKQRMSVICD